MRNHFLINFSGVYAITFALFCVPIVNCQRCIKIGDKCTEDDGTTGTNRQCCTGGACSSTVCIPAAVPTLCIPDKKTCIFDGRLGWCCSGNCFQNADQPTGFCMEKATISPDAPNACIEDNERCHSSGTLGWCCSGFCLQDVSEQYGSCKPKNTTGKEKSKPDRWGNRDRDRGLNTSHIIAIVFGVITVLLLTGIIVVIVVRMNRKTNVLTQKDIREFLRGIPLEQQRLDMANDNVYIHERVDVVPYDKSYEIPERDFTIDYQNVLGSGTFGIVMRSVIRGEAVAAKTIKPGSDAAQIKALLSELKVMIYIGKHPNVVNLIGASTTKLQSGSVHIFVELCANGSLEKFLRTNREKFISQTTDTNEIRSYQNIQVDRNDSGWICTKDLLTWSAQIAYGMDYLSRKKIVHADLATRNVLLNEKMVAKITDFGLSRKLYDYTNYVKTKQEPLPWRWMAIESLREFSFSTQSDVWAFGITLWEIFSLGNIPYPGLSWSVEFVDNLIQNLRPTKPMYASNDLYELMTDCWHFNPKARPTFADLSENLREFSDLLNTED